MSQVIHPHPGGDGYRRDLGDLDCPLANNVAAQYPAGRAVDDQFAKAHRAPVDDRARGRVEAYNRGHDIVCFTGLCFSQTHLGILRVREAADRTHRVPNRHRRASHGVGSRHEAVLNRLRDQHQATGNVPSGKDMGRGSPQIPINLHEPPMIGLDARRSEAQPGSIGGPAYRHDR